MYIPCIYIVYYIHILIIYHVYPEYIPGIYLRYTIHIPGIYIGYTIHIYCICKVYTKDKQCSIYNEYAWYITGISHPDWYMHGIYMVYTWYIHGIFHPYGVLIHMYGIYHVKHLWVCSVPFFILIYLWYTMYILWIYLIYHTYINIKKGTEQTHKCFTWYIPYIWMRTPYGWNIPCIYHVYTMYIPCICCGYRFTSCISLQPPCTFIIHQYIPCIYHVYTMYILDIYLYIQLI